jgi:serine phosphatase RsbU (regulator of sigma subunit)
MKIRTAILILLLTGFAPQFLVGQDTLLVNAGLAHERLADSAKASDFLEVASNFVLSGTVDSAIIYINRSLNLAATRDFIAIEAGCYELLGSIFEKRTEFNGMLLNYLKASNLYNKSGMFENEASVIKKIAGRYFDLGANRKSADYFEQEYNLYSESNYLKKAEASENTALSWYFQFSDSLSLKWFLISSGYYKRASNTEGELRCALKLADIYLKLKAFGLAMDQYEMLLDARLRTNDYQQVAIIYNNMGYLRFRQRDFENAINNFNSASEYSRKGGTDNGFLTDVNTNLAISYQLTGREKEMMQYFRNAHVYAGRAERYDEAARLDHILATIYFREGDNYHAELFCRECIESAGKSPGDTIMKDCYLTLSRVMEKGNDYPKALEYYERYLSIRDSINLERRLKEKNISDRLSGYDELDKNLRFSIAEQEIQTLALSKLRADSARRENELKLLLKQQELVGSENKLLAQSLALEKEQSELARRNLVVRSLKDKQRSDSLSIVNQNIRNTALEEKNKGLEAEQKLQAENLRKQKLLKQMGFGMGILAVIVAIMILAGLISTRRKNQKLADSKAHIEIINADLETKNREISLQKDIIEQKNQSITDSIQYASRIQSAVLPPINFLTDWGIDNFILYKPKDIVSGDFYWGKMKDEKIIVAAADCTGHGVPGAFMSMLGHAFLDEIVNTTIIKDAAGILNMLRDEIINTLKQKGMVGEARDGMDISLCIIDRKNGIIDFAGANNPLYLIRDGRLIKMQADRMPIGIHVTSLSPFTNRTFEVTKGDHIYIFSDGFADQFGGPKGKKYMYKPFQNLLLRNHDKPMEQQREILDTTFVSWVGEREQVDDVLVIGMKL